MPVARLHGHTSVILQPQHSTAQHNHSTARVQPQHGITNCKAKQTAGRGRGATAPQHCTTTAQHHKANRQANRCAFAYEEQILGEASLVSVCRDLKR